MCPKDENIIRLLVQNNIPLVLNFNRKRSEIFLYISTKVEHNILKPIFEKKRYNNRIICPVSYRTLIILEHDNFKVIRHTGGHTRTVIYFVILKNPSAPTLQIFPLRNNEIIYYGIKNMKIKTYTEPTIETVIRTYLL
jgi:hypothetical protein